ncbi:MAG: hypothetical protein RR393_07835 [Bacteroidales bacterium]
MSKFKISFFCLCTLLLFSACQREQKKAGKVAEQFLTAYYVDLDFKKAISLATESSQEGIYYKESMTQLNPYAKEETPNLKVGKITIDTKDKNKAICEYKVNDQERELPLTKKGEQWKVDTKGSTVEMPGSFSGTEGGGFASSASGPVHYKARKQEKK